MVTIAHHCLELVHYRLKALDYCACASLRGLIQEERTDSTQTRNNSGVQWKTWSSCETQIKNCMKTQQVEGRKSPSQSLASLAAETREIADNSFSALVDQEGMLLSRPRFFWAGKTCISCRTNVWAFEFAVACFLGLRILLCFGTGDEWLVSSRLVTICISFCELHISVLTSLQKNWRTAIGL